jgi:hypothetical protein
MLSVALTLSLRSPAVAVCGSLACDIDVGAVYVECYVENLDGLTSSRKLSLRSPSS